MQSRSTPGALPRPTGQLRLRWASGPRVACALAGPEVQHYRQPVAIVVASSFDQARVAAQLVRLRYERTRGSFDLASEKGSVPAPQPLQPGPVMARKRK